MNQDKLLFFNFFKNCNQDSMKSYKLLLHKKQKNKVRTEEKCNILEFTLRKNLVYNLWFHNFKSKKEDK